MKELNKKQIETLFDFVKSKYVRYIDVQHELVDHLATDIEFKMGTDSALSFDEALNNVYSKFPISGFSNYVKKSESAMNRFWIKMIFKQFIKFGGIPVLLSLVALTCLQYIFMVVFGNVAFIILIAFTLIIGFLAFRGMKTIVKGQEKNIDEKYLVVTIFKGLAFSFCMIPALTANIFTDISTSNTITIDNISWRAFAYALLFSANLIWCYMSYYKFPQLIRSVLNEKYAHLKLSV